VVIIEAKSTAYHLEIQTHRKKPYGLLRNSYRIDGKVRHETLCRFNGLSMEQLRGMQAALQGKSLSLADLRVTDSCEYGASWTLYSLAKEIELDKIIYSHSREPWVQDVLAMLIGRIVYAGSKLSLSNCGSYSALWEICGVTDKEIDVDKHCYDAMDTLLKHQDDIQKKLAARHLSDGCAILYDITSSYLEGEYEDNEIVKYGYNRDKKRGKKQIVIGLICNKEGCPVSVEVFAGNTKDGATVPNKISEIKDKYGIKDAVFIGDRGMLTASNLESANIKTITALTHPRIKQLCKDNNIQLSLFDEHVSNEVILPDEPGIRYCLRRNPVRTTKEHEMRQKLIKKTEEALKEISEPKRKVTDAKLGIRAGKVINKYKMSKYFDVQIADSKITWSLMSDKISEDEEFDGLYVIRSDVSAERLSTDEVVKSYKNLIHVEQAFRILKTARLEIRPLYHYTEDRIRAHVFLCMLSYYLLWHMNQRLTPLYDDHGKVGKNRKYTIDYVMEILKAIRKEKVIFQNAKSEIITEPNGEQQKILELLGVSLK
jgi:transposase